MFWNRVAWAAMALFIAGLILLASSGVRMKHEIPPLAYGAVAMMLAGAIVLPLAGIIRDLVAWRSRRRPDPPA